ncbi:hypothetical protein CASFOL_014418 [Castilleja foliolosa]|uniref:Probable purine permease n=1 Tax=Castilleja foliolosa TaxID=1961234 RepID=A0ABD3DMT9_9LAMI
MAEAQELQQNINDLKGEIKKSPENGETINKTPSKLFPCFSQYKWWIQMITYSFFVIAGQSIGTLLGRLYFNNGGESEWMATLVQVVGFPILFPYLWLTTSKNDPISETNTSNSNTKHLASFYIAIGIFNAADCMLYSIGIQYLPVTTYTLICASQLAFNAVFSYFLNKQKFTPYIVNSLVLLTISSILLVFQSDPGDSNKASKKKYILGFLCTLAASAGYALMLSLTQIAFRKIIKKETIKAVINMTVYSNMVASLVIVIGLFASGDWKRMGKEMRGYKLGQVSYVMNLIWTAVSWQVFSVGCVGLIFKVSSLFSNVISILGLPVAPILAVIFISDKLTGLKGMAMLLAMWGFVSYMYQHYLDDLKMKEKSRLSGNQQEDALVEERG